MGRAQAAFEDRFGFIQLAGTEIRVADFSHLILFLLGYALEVAERDSPFEKRSHPFGVIYALPFGERR